MSPDHKLKPQALRIIKHLTMNNSVNKGEQPPPITESPSTPPLQSNQLVPLPYLPTPSHPSLFHLHQYANQSNDEYFNSFPAGYKFNPDDDELIVHYLNRKIKNLPLPRNKIIDIKLYDYNPKELSERFEHYGSKVKEKKWYFFTPRDKKYKNGSRPNRAAGKGSGYWKATGADKKVRHNGELVGFRKSLVFYVGRPPKGTKTNWIMHEFRVAHPPKPKNNGAHDMKLDDWVLCSIHEKDDRPSKNRQQEDSASASGSASQMEEDPENDNHNDNDNALMLSTNDELPPFPESYNHSLITYPMSPTTTYNPFLDFGSNHLAEDLYYKNQIDYANFSFGSNGWTPIMPNNPFQRFNKGPFQTQRIAKEELIYGGGFHELDPSNLINVPLPDVAAPQSENHQPQPLKFVDYNSVVQPFSITQNLDNSVVQTPPVENDETPADENFETKE